MSTIKIYQVDAFADRLFTGNPAAVCPLNEWLPDDVMLRIAAENNLSETAFFVRRGDHFDLRWFTPKMEVPICGHATMAAAFVLFDQLGQVGDDIRFETKSGLLAVRRKGPELEMDFPALEMRECSVPAGLTEALGEKPTACFESDIYVALFDKAETVQKLSPDMRKIAVLDKFAVSATAPGVDVDYVARHFAPRRGVEEDPVTGRLHCMLAPYWGQRLGKLKLVARQLSQRGGTVVIRLDGDRVILVGRAVLYLTGEIHI